MNITARNFKRKRMDYVDIERQCAEYDSLCGEVTVRQATQEELEQLKKRIQNKYNPKKYI